MQTCIEDAESQAWGWFLSCPFSVSTKRLKKGFYNCCPENTSNPSMQTEGKMDCSMQVQPFRETCPLIYIFSSKNLRLVSEDSRASQGHSLKILPYTLHQKCCLFILLLISFSINMTLYKVVYDISFITWFYMAEFGSCLTPLFNCNIYCAAKPLVSRLLIVLEEPHAFWLVSQQKDANICHRMGATTSG